MDKFSKFAQTKLILTRAAIDVVRIIKELIKKYHPPKILVLDGEKTFSSRELKTFRI